MGLKCGQPGGKNIEQNEWYILILLMTVIENVGELVTYEKVAK